LFDRICVECHIEGLYCLFITSSAYLFNAACLPSEGLTACRAAPRWAAPDMLVALRYRQVF
jgi:hypothetical protein